MYFLALVFFLSSEKNIIHKNTPKTRFVLFCFFVFLNFVFILHLFIQKPVGNGPLPRPGSSGSPGPAHSPSRPPSTGHPASHGPPPHHGPSGPHHGPPGPYPPSGGPYPGPGGPMHGGPMGGRMMMRPSGPHSQVSTSQQILF